MYIKSTSCKNDRISTKYLVFIVKSAQFSAFFKTHLLFILLYWTVDHFNKLKKNHCNKFGKLHHNDLVFCPFQRLFNISSILKCILKLLQMVCEIITQHSCQIWALHITFTVLEARKFKQKKQELLKQIMNL